MKCDEPVTVFYDSEWTDIAPDADLLSIGFTACDVEAELYIELSDAEVHRSSDFVKQVVLPHHLLTHSYPNRPPAHPISSSRSCCRCLASTIQK